MLRRGPVALTLWVSTLLPSFALAQAPVRLRPLQNADGDHPIHQSHAIVAPKQQKAARNDPRLRPANIDVLHYDIDIHANPANGLIEGTTAVTFRSLVEGLDEVVLDASEMQFVEVRDAAGQALSWRYDGELLTITAPTPLAGREEARYTIRYRALASQELYLTGPDATDPNRMVAAYTYTQPEGARAWFPSLDRPADKATLSIAVTVPAGQRALSNGVPTGEETLQNGDHRFAYRLEQPIATYLVSLNLGAYESHDIGNFQGKPLTLWTPPDLAAATLREAAPTQRMMEIFSSFTGVDYPFPLYQQSVADAWRSSMEHETATTMGGARMSGDGTGAGVVAHELAHQWFGDWVTCRNWGELWLNEGFATYLPYIFFKGIGESNRALGEVEWWRTGYFNESRTKARALSETDPDIGGIFDSHSYEKGALVIRWMSTLANRMPVVHGAGGRDPRDADGTFTEVLRHYLTVNGGSTVTSQSLQEALEHVTGQSWQMFFDHWTRSAGHPELAVSYATRESGVLTVRIEQTQATREQRKWRTFTLPLPVEIHLADGTRLERSLDLYDDVQEFRVPVQGQVVALVVDPEWLAPVEAQIAQDAAAWRHVALHSPIATSRIQAVRALRSLSAANIDSTLADTIAADATPLVITTAIAALTNDPMNRGTVARLHRALEEREATLDVPSRAALYDSERWLVETLETLPSREQQDVWRRRYDDSSFTNERKAIVAMLAKADRPALQQFAIDKLRTANLVTTDEMTLIDAITLSPTDTATAWIQQVLEAGLTPNYFVRVLTNLQTANYDRAAIVPALISQANTHRYYYVRTAAIGLLAKQTSSRDTVCPALRELTREGRPNEVKRVAETALRTLTCP